MSLPKIEKAPVSQHRERTPTMSSVNTMTWEQDAKLFGQLSRDHKVYLALLAARCVKLSRSGVSVKTDTSAKTSAASFGKAAGIVANTVKTYLKVWEAMAKDGIVPSRDDLVPGVDVELPDKATFTKYYRQAVQAPAPTKALDEKTTEEASEVSESKTREAPTTKAVKQDDTAGYQHILTGLQEITRKAQVALLSADLEGLRDLLIEQSKVLDVSVPEKLATMKTSATPAKTTRTRKPQNVREALDDIVKTGAQVAA